MTTLLQERPRTAVSTNVSAFGAIYPHEPRVGKLALFAGGGDKESKAKAGITLFYGPLVIRAKLVQNEKGLFLAMPSRKSEAGTWWDHAYIQDDGLKQTFERLAIALYQESVNDFSSAA